MTIKVTVLSGNDLKEFKEELTKELYGETEAGHCVCCKEEFCDKNTYTEAGWRETKISGLCENCFDGITREAE